MPRAPKKCANPQCEERVVARTYCTTHTPVWKTTTRRQRLPSNWPALREAAKQAANGRCQALVHHRLCDGVGDECDHIHPGDDHSPLNLQWLSTVCHKAKTARESRDRNRTRTQ